MAQRDCENVTTFKNMCGYVQTRVGTNYDHGQITCFLNIEKKKQLSWYAYTLCLRASCLQYALTFIS